MLMKSIVTLCLVLLLGVSKIGIAEEKDMTTAIPGMEGWMKMMGQMTQGIQPDSNASVQNPMAHHSQYMQNPMMGMMNPMAMMNPMMMMNPMAMMGGGNNPFVPFMTPQNWVNPNAYMAFMNPNSYMAMMNPMTYMAFMNPAMYMQLMNPASYMAFMNPSTYAPMMNPNTYLQMLNQMLMMSHMGDENVQNNFMQQWLEMGQQMTPNQEKQ